MKNSVLKYILQDGLYELFIGVFGVLFTVTTPFLVGGHTGLLTSDKLPDIILYVLYLIAVSAVINVLRKKYTYNRLGVAKPSVAWIHKTMLMLVVPILCFILLLIAISIIPFSGILVGKFNIGFAPVYYTIAYLRLFSIAIILSICSFIIFTQVKILQFAFYAVSLLLFAGGLGLIGSPERIDLLILFISTSMIIGGIISFGRLIKSSQYDKDAE